eukprot:scaffold125359_cov43-Prasinocladus_malaysianus.AAC.1
MQHSWPYLGGLGSIYLVWPSWLEVGTLPIGLGIRDCVPVSRHANAIARISQSSPLSSNECIKVEANDQSLPPLCYMFSIKCLRALEGIMIRERNSSDKTFDVA